MKVVRKKAVEMTTAAVMTIRMAVRVIVKTHLLDQFLEKIILSANTREIIV